MIVKFSYCRGEYSWLVSDQGDGFLEECKCPLDEPDLPPEEAENGRGICILHQIFDQVHWNNQGTQVRLSKYVNRFSLTPNLVS